MTAVRGSKQYQMMVVPYRPLYRISIFCLCLGAVAAFSWLTYHYGMNEGLATRVEVIQERDELRGQLTESARLVRDMRQMVADLKLGGKVDSRANEEVQLTVETLQDKIAALEEEIRFYKGVMLPTVKTQGLRIERLDLKANGDEGSFKFGLLLTQIVEKHDYVQGSVNISLLGDKAGVESKLSLSDMTLGKQSSIRFRFRYFQNIEGKVMIPEGFVPRELLIVAKGSGRNSQSLEKKFDWALNEE